MTQVLVKKDGDVSQGMQDAGEKISEWMRYHGTKDRPGRPEDFFVDLWASLPESDGYKFFVTENGDNELSPPDSNKKLKYEYDEGGTKKNGRLFPQSKEDFKKNGIQRNMSIPIPEKSDSILEGYVGTIVQNVKVLGDDAAKKYLLAVIFLNRCQ